MKTPYALFTMAVGSASLLVYFGCAKDQNAGGAAGTDHNVVIEKDRIVIPGTNLSAADRQAMNNILKRYDRSLYKVDTYEDGVLKSRQGTLSDVVIGRKLASELAANVGRPACAQFVATRGSVPHLPMRERSADSQELLNALKPILEKYSKPGSNTR